jgi:hypothetical protein
MSDDGLGRWLDDLRHRVARGDLSHLRPIELGHGTRRLPTDVTVRTMLSDLDDLDDPNGSAARNPAWRAERLSVLLNDLRRVRDLLG